MNFYSSKLKIEKIQILLNFYAITTLQIYWKEGLINLDKLIKEFLMKIPRLTKLQLT